MKNKTICIVGLGYVGLPLAETFSNHLKTIGFDIDQEKVKRLSESKNEDNIEFTSDPSKIKQADFCFNSSANTCNEIQGTRFIFREIFASQSRALPASPQALEGLTLLKMLT